MYAPVPKPRDPKVDRHAAKPGDGEAVAAWRARMATPEAKEIYKDRASTAECVNAQARNRGLIRLLVRGRWAAGHRVDYLIVGGEDHKVGTEEDTEKLPSYAPETNPDESVWGHTKHGRLAKGQTRAR